MKYLTAIGMLLLAARAAAQQEVSPPDNLSRITRVDNAVAKESIEDIALTFFREISFFDQEYPSPNVQLPAKDLLRERDGLSESEAEEVIAIARRLRAPEAAEKMRANFRVSSRKFCADLREAASREETLVVLESHEAQVDAENRLTGSSLLGELKPSSRAHLIKALAEYRKGVSVVSIEWRKAKPEQLEAQKNQICSQVH